MPVKMTGEPSEFNGRPAFDFSAIEQLPVEFHIAPALALSRQVIPAAQTKKLIAVLGDDCIAKVAANRDVLTTPGLRFRPASCDKIDAACHAIQALDRVETALLQCGVSKESIPKILDRWNETRDHYALVLARHLSFVRADHLAQTSLVQARTPFDRDGVRRAVGVLAQVLNDARRNGHCGVSCQSLESAARQQYSFPHEIIRQAMADLVASGRFATFDEDGAVDFLWHKSLLAAERGNSKRHTSLAPGMRNFFAPASKRSFAMQSRHVRLKPGTEGPPLRTEGPR